MVELLYTSPLKYIATGIRNSHDNHHLSDTSEKIEECYYNAIVEDRFDNSCDHVIGPKDFKLINRVGFKLKHESVLEHSLIVFNFTITRALLQELSRHRIGVSPTVKSSRFTLTELRTLEVIDPDKLTSSEKKELNRIELPLEYSKNDYLKYKDFVGEYVRYVNDNELDELIYQSFLLLVKAVKTGKANDKTKYLIPESLWTKGQWSFNLRSLLHLLKLRLPKDALYEFRELSFNIIQSLPYEYKELLLSDADIKKNYDDFRKLKFSTVQGSESNLVELVKYLSYSEAIEYFKDKNIDIKCFDKMNILLLDDSIYLSFDDNNYFNTYFLSESALQPIELVIGQLYDYANKYPNSEDFNSEVLKILQDIKNSPKLKILDFIIDKDNDILQSSFILQYNNYTMSLPLLEFDKMLSNLEQILKG